MERDFLGLSSKETVSVVKEEIVNDGFKDPSSGFNNGSAIQWPFANRVSALPHLMSFKVAQEDKTKKNIVSEPLMSTGFMSISDSTQKHATGDIQKSFNQDRQGGTHFSMTAYPAQHDHVHFVHRPHDTKMFPVSNQSISVSMGNPFFKNHFATTGPIAKQQLLGGVPVTAPYPVLQTMGSIAGITEPRNDVIKGSSAPAQLTIFYGGQVNVYNDISPEKAQAIMFLAGNAPSISPNSTHPKVQLQAPNSKPDNTHMNQSLNIPTCSSLASPLSVSSHTGAQSGSGSTSTDEPVTAKTSGVATTLVSNAEPPKMVNAMVSITTTTMIPSAVPQARKASLARFLEKRKERVMSSGPYNFSKKSPECANF